MRHAWFRHWTAPSLRTVCALGLALALSSRGASAQAVLTPPDPEKVRVRLGPLLMNPTFTVNNAGVDTNVFNVSDADHPQSDFTATMTPQTDLWMRAGPTWLNGIVKEDLVWYRTYSSERSANTNVKANWVVPMSRVSLGVGGDWTLTRERPGFEIDLRSRRTETAYNGVLELHALSKTYIGVRVEQRTIDFDDGDVFLGTNLHDELNRTVTTASVTLRNQLTPLTSFTLDVDREQARFDFDPLRNSNSTRVTAGLLFDRLAFITGQIRVGVRDFAPLSADVPAFQGAIAAVDVACVALASTRFALQATRDVHYSYDANRPYFVQSGVSGSIAQQIFGPIDVEGRIGATRLAYSARIGTAAELVDRTDHVRSYGAGVGYHVGQSLRIAFNVDQTRRDSAVDNRTYHGLRYGTALTYGF